MTTTHLFTGSDGKTVRVDLTIKNERELARLLGNKALSARRRKATAFDGLIAVSVERVS